MKARARVSEENKERSVFFHQAVKGPEKALKTTWSNFFYKDLSLFITVHSAPDHLLPGRVLLQFSKQFI